MHATEKQIETSILDYLNTLKGCFAFKIHMGGIYDPRTKRMRSIKNKHHHKGTCDIIGVYRGKFFAIEVKRPKTEVSGKSYPTKDQKMFIQRVQERGGTAGVARSLRDAMLIMEGMT